MTQSLYNRTLFKKNDIKMTEKMTIPSRDGKYLSAVVHWPERVSSQLAILCPGHVDSKDYAHLVHLANSLTKEGYTVVRFDFLGTWESDGAIDDYSIQQQLSDIKTVLEFMLQKESFAHVLLGGHSRGGTVSILYAAVDPRVSAVLAIMSPFALFRTVTSENLAKWKEKGFKISKRDVPNSSKMREFRLPYSNMEEANRFNVLDYVGKLHVPVFLVTGERDDVVLPEEVKRIYETANEPKHFLSIKGIDHDYRHNDAEIEMVDKEILTLLRRAQV